MQKVEVKRDIKKDAKKLWAAIVRFLRPYRNLDKLMLKPKVEPFLKKHIQFVYLAGVIVLALLAIIQLGNIRNISAVLGAWIVLLIIFVLFRLACELLVGTSSHVSEETKKDEEVKEKKEPKIKEKTEDELLEEEVLKALEEEEKAEKKKAKK